MVHKVFSWYKYARPSLYFVSLKNEVEVRIWSDASLTLKNMRAVYGAVIQVVPPETALESKVNIIHFATKRGTTMVPSTFAAELRAAIFGLSLFVRVFAGMEAVLGPSRKIVKVVLCCDNSALVKAVAAGDTSDAFAVPYLKFLVQE